MVKGFFCFHAEFFKLESRNYLTCFCAGINLNNLFFNLISTLNLRTDSTLSILNSQLPLRSRVPLATPSAFSTLNSQFSIKYEGLLLMTHSDRVMYVIVSLDYL
jgi:hypothetical protein